MRCTVTSCVQVASFSPLRTYSSVAMFAPFVLFASSKVWPLSAIRLDSGVGQGGFLRH